MEDDMLFLNVDFIRLERQAKYVDLHPGNSHLIHPAHRGVERIIPGESGGKIHELDLVPVEHHVAEPDFTVRDSGIVHFSHRAGKSVPDLPVALERGALREKVRTFKSLHHDLVSIALQQSRCDFWAIVFDPPQDICFALQKISACGEEW